MKTMQMNIRNIRIVGAAVVTIIVACAQSASAAVIAYENFEGLTSANASLAGQGAGTGWNGTWNSGELGARLVSPGLDSSTVTARIHNGYGNAQSWRSFAPGITIGGAGYTDTVYYGVTARIGATDTGQALVGLGGVGETQIGKANSNDNWVISARSVSFTLLTIDSGVAITKDVENRLVLRLDYSGSGMQATLWVNPLNESSPFALQTGVNALTQNQRTTATINSAGTITGSRFDNIQVGSSFGDALTIIPEPSSFVLLLLGGSLLLVLALRRRRAVTLS